ncbi:MAG: exodeoxyribonuclease VII large subunit [Planctomycetota bacterium]|jgi:exodeoxyribonuclease VII large subunit
MSETFRQSEHDKRALTVSELTALIKESLETSFANVYVIGEISRCTRASSGHVYLTLKDENAVLQAVIWRGVASALRFELKEGLEVVAHGNIDVYAPRGSYQLIVSWMEPKGLGALQLAFRQLVEKLEKEGLFREELKKPLPPFPRRIGVVTSPTGAAIRDIINVISRRFPAVELYLLPSRVQGAEAAREIAAAIDALNAKRPDLDLMIVGRGGGSLEDLWPFNEEVVARAIHRSAIPVVSAVGHEIDFSVSDFVADVRAATPTEAGEIVVPDRHELLERTQERRRRMALTLGAMVEGGRQRLDALTSRYAFRHPDAALREKAQRADEVLERLKTLFAHRLGLLREAISGVGRRLEALSPLGVLERGYSLTFGPDGRLVRAVAALSPGDTISTRLHHGEVLSEVLQLTDPQATESEEAEGED